MEDYQFELNRRKEELLDKMQGHVEEAAQGFTSEPYEERMKNYERTGGHAEQVVSLCKELADIERFGI